jgi:putative thioredoxin
MDITLQNFQTDVIEASMAQPVLLDIWAPWCGPCKALTPVLEAVQVQYAGRLQLAKLNADEQAQISGQLSQMFGVRSIPFCVLFKDGQAVDGFVGALPQAQIQEFLDRHVPSVDALSAQKEVAQADALLHQGQPQDALQKLQTALETDPANDALRYRYVRALLMLGQLDTARVAFAPVATKTLLDTQLAALEHWLSACEDAPSARPQAALLAAIEANPRDFDAQFEMARCHLAAQRFTDALEALLEIIGRDKTWQDQAPRKTYVAILELMAEPQPPAQPAAASAPAAGTLELTGKIAAPSRDPVIDHYRRRLSMVLF